MNLQVMTDASKLLGHPGLGHSINCLCLQHASMVLDEGNAENRVCGTIANKLMNVSKLQETSR